MFRSRSATSIRLLAYDGQGFWLAQKRLSKGRFRWWPSGDGPARSLEAYQAQLLLAAGNPDTQAAPMWRRSELIQIQRKKMPCVQTDFLSHCCCAGSSGAIEDVRLARRRLFSFGSSSTNTRTQPLCLVQKVCEAWQWKQANGELRDMVCRGLLLMLERAGAIQLPAARRASPNSARGARTPGTFSARQSARARSFS